MKKAMKQTTMVSILNTICIALLVGIVICQGFDIALNENIDKANQKRFDLTYYANAFIKGSETLTNDVQAYAATGNREYYNGYMNELNVDKNRDNSIAKLQELGLTDEEEQMIADMSALSNDLVPLEEQAMEKVSNGHKAEALQYVYGTEYANTIEQIKVLRTDFLSKIDERAFGRVQTIERQCAVVRVLSIILIIALVILQFIQNRLIRRQVIYPVIKIRDEMIEIAKGNLSAEFTLQADTSEIGMLIGAIHDTKEQLHRYIGHISRQLSEMAGGNMDIHVDMEYIGDFKPIKDSLEVILNAMNHTLSRMEDAAIQDAAIQTSGHADQVASGAQALAQGTTEQASTVEELSATINDLTESMGHIAKTAEKTKKLTQEAAETLNTGNQKMTEMKQAIHDIDATSKEIGKIIKTIEDIAFQTNILALNAAVEAVRAGAAGKGFAVVADEVRNLANKSQEASRQTTTLIDNSIHAVSRGVKLTDETAETIALVVEGTHKSTQYIETIAGDLDQQAAALRQVNIGVDQISSVVQTNSATAEQSAAASQELSLQAGEVQKMVSSFKLRKH